ncbi:MAG: DUF4158 domain-containing protein, partial [Cyanobacteria bacterium J06555_12]
MPSIQETAYPRLKSNPSSRDLESIYTPTADELDFARRLARTPVNQLGVLVQLKTFQRLGYSVSVRSVPPVIVHHIAEVAQLAAHREQLVTYDGSRSQFRHLAAVRDYLHISPYGLAAEQAMTTVMEQAAVTKYDLADLINIAIEELVRQRFELPAFSTLIRFAQQVRQLVSNRLYHQVVKGFGRDEILQIERLFFVDPHTRTTLWERLKDEPGPPVLSRLKVWIERLAWLASFQWARAALAEVPGIQIDRFAAEAKTLGAARMKEIDKPRRYTLVVALLAAQYSRTLDDLAELAIKRLRKLHHKGKEALAQYRLDMQKRTDQLIGTLQETVVAYRSEGEIPQRFAAIERVLGEHSEQLLEDCEAHMAYVGNNYFPFLLKFYRSHRAALMDLLEILPLHSSTQDTSLIEAIRFIRRHRRSRKQWLPTEIAIASDGESDEGDGEVHQTLDFSWIPKKWWALISGQSKRMPMPETVHRLHFELCVLSHVSLELQSGDLYIEGSHDYGNYSQQLIDWDEYQAGVAEYGAAIGLPVHPKAFVEQIKQRLDER